MQGLIQHSAHLQSTSECLVLPVLLLFWFSVSGHLRRQQELAPVFESLPLTWKTRIGSWALGSALLVRTSRK